MTKINYRKLLKICKYSLSLWNFCLKKILKEQNNDFGYRKQLVNFIFYAVLETEDQPNNILVHFIFCLLVSNQDLIREGKKILSFLV